MERIMTKTMEQETLDVRKYNVCIGVSLLIGLLLTAICTYVLKDSVGMMFYAHPIIFSILYLVVGIGAGHIAIESSSTPVAATCYVVINVATGALMSSCIPYEKASILLNAAITTGIILVIMVAAASVYPKAFTRLGNILLTSLIAFIVAEFIMLLFFRTEPAIMDWIAIGIFTLYIGYDWSKGMEYPKTAHFAIITAINLYLDLINIFIRLVSRSSSNRRK